MDPITISIVIGAVLVGTGIGVGCKIYYSRDLNKKHKAYQDKEAALQKELERLRKLYREKQEEIRRAEERRAWAAEKLKEEVARREKILKIIEALERRLDPQTGTVSRFTGTTVALAGTLGAICSKAKPFAREGALVALYDDVERVSKATLSMTAGIGMHTALSVLDEAIAFFSTDEMEQNLVKAEELLKYAKEMK